jgi:hypothetical protein
MADMNRTLSWAMIVGQSLVAVFFLFTPVRAPLLSTGLLIAAVVAAVIQAAATWALPARWPLLLGAGLSAVGWGSWVLVALTSEPNDPVINITGLLVASGLLMSVAAMFGQWAGAAGDRPRAFLFAGLYLALFAVYWLRPDFLSSLPLALVVGSLLPAMLGTTLAGFHVAYVHLLPRIGARTVALAGGYLSLVGYALVIPASLVALPGAALVALAAVMWRRRSMAPT